MKKLLIGLSAAVLSTAAIAAVYTAVGSGSSRVEACTAAKENAAAWLRGTKGAEVQSFSQCACEQSSTGVMWTCSVDATY